MDVGFHSMGVSHTVVERIFFNYFYPLKVLFLNTNIGRRGQGILNRLSVTNS